MAMDHGMLVCMYFHLVDAHSAYRALESWSIGLSFQIRFVTVDDVKDKIISLDKISWSEKIQLIKNQGSIVVHDAQSKVPIGSFNVSCFSHVEFVYKDFGKPSSHI